jgi:hypothetical protein
MTAHPAPASTTFPLLDPLGAASPIDMPVSADPVPPTVPLLVEPLPLWAPLAPAEVPLVAEVPDVADPLADPLLDPVPALAPVAFPALAPDDAPQPTNTGAASETRTARLSALAIADALMALRKATLVPCPETRLIAWIQAFTVVPL